MPRIISDVHGKIDQYIEIAKQSPDGYSIQLGDMGFDYSKLHESGLSVLNHAFIKGNHDNYDVNSHYQLGNYGTILNDIFYVRGSISIDAAARVNHYLMTGIKTWWYEEELSPYELNLAYDEYCTYKPKIMLSHDCPSSLKEYVKYHDDLTKFGLPVRDITCNTQKYLQLMLDYHQPDLFIFGHWHVNFSKKIGNTQFVCMRELGFIDI